uniref:Uncharacterized protein n=1 Tax=Arundo donax TaxID=35708 RepID=A0A0A9FCL2_ARUDO
MKTGFLLTFLAHCTTGIASKIMSKIFNSEVYSCTATNTN